MTGLSIVIVSWNSAPELGPLLASIERHLQGREVVVVDNASSDGSAALAKELGASRVVDLPENRGFGAAANVGVRAASLDVVALLNPDTILVDNSLVALSERARIRRAILGPELVSPSGVRQPSASPAPGGWETAVVAFFPAVLMPTWLRFRCEPWRSPTNVDVGWLTGACLVARRDFLLELGPFDERIHLYGEDLDLGIRARRTGARNVYSPDVARVVHLGDRSSQRRFADSGLELSIRNRRLVVQAGFGRGRERFDFGLQVVYHALRWVAKRMLRRDCTREQRWLTTASRLARQQ